MDITGVVAIICLFIGAPGITFGFILVSKKLKRDVEILKYKKEILELEVEKERIREKVLEAENKKYDRLIENNG